jgi:hypothetical protein
MYTGLAVSFGYIVNKGFEMYKLYNWLRDTVPQCAHIPDNVYQILVGGVFILSFGKYIFSQVGNYLWPRYMKKEDLEDPVRRAEKLSQLSHYSYNTFKYACSTAVLYVIYKDHYILD